MEFVLLQDDVMEDEQTVMPRHTLARASVRLAAELSGSQSSSMDGIDDTSRSTVELLLSRIPV